MFPENEHFLAFLAWVRISALLGGSIKSCLYLAKGVQKAMQEFYERGSSSKGVEKQQSTKRLLGNHLSSSLINGPQPARIISPTDKADTKKLPKKININVISIIPDYASL